MSCPRCAGAVEPGGTTWCKTCEQLYDTWLRQHAADIVWQVLVGGLVLSALGVGLPLLGVGSLVGAIAAFAGFGTILGLSRWTRHRRRHQFLESPPLPRAYLPPPR